MPLFQTSVLKKYLKSIESKEEVKVAYEKFTTYFHNVERQENIRKSKEEQFQEGFLRELFVKVLGYTINPEPNYNLTTELKNVKDAKKADGAILSAGKPIGVIELKGTSTTDLNKIENQAFGYKNNHEGVTYIITSNFEKLRLYIDNAIDFEEFYLFDLSFERFALLWLLLAKDNIFKDLGKQIKNDSLTEEEQITKKLYKDYSTFRQKLFNNIVELNPQYDKLRLFKKTQKLLDRFLFIFFAEDRLLLPPNSTYEILNQWKMLKDELDAYFPLYSRFKKYFGYLDKGHKGRQYDIFAYNGGLFKPDELLDSIKIDDDLLYFHTKQLSDYDFDSDVDVNILGHIFENSLNEIEEISAEIEGEDIDRTKTKRKKDGVFYTPKYITKYIVDNTVGTLCEEQKKAIGLDESEFEKNRKGRRKTTLERLQKQLDDYRSWLLDLTICDPACGSGAFLNQALEFLIEEHHYVDELQNKLLGGTLMLSDVANSILEKNLYGVDINNESVEIAKLSLWLRTAQKGRKLTSLNNNIKCGNSLIDDPEVAGDKAFNWEKEFPEVFAQGGFDVVIGNPPYVRQELVKEYLDLLKTYKVYSGKADLYVFFYEKAFHILKKGGCMSFISSGKFLEASYGKKLIDFLVENLTVKHVINFDDLEVFKGISAYPLIFTAFKKAPIGNYSFDFCYVPDLTYTLLNEVVTKLVFLKIELDDFKSNKYKFFSKEVTSVFKKINKNSVYLEDLGCMPLVGVKTGFNNGFLIEKDDVIHARSYLFGKNIKRYQNPRSDLNILFPYERKNDAYELISEDNLGKAVDFLLPHKSRLVKRAVIKEGVSRGTKFWYEYQQINKTLDFDLEYIIYPNVSLGTNFTLSKGNVIDMTGFIIPSNDKFLLAVLNSKISEFVMRNTAITRRGGYQEYKIQYLKKVPLKKVSNADKKPFIDLVDQVFVLYRELDEFLNSFRRLIKYKLLSNAFSRKMMMWNELEFAEFWKELEKARKKVAKDKGEAYKKLGLGEEAEWMQYFEEQKQKAQAIQSKITIIDNEINQMVYELYGLTEEEIAIVEEAL